MTIKKQNFRCLTKSKIRRSQSFRVVPQTI